MGVTAAVSMVAMSTAATAYSKTRAGAETKGIYDQNAIFAERQAQDAEQRGELDAGRMRRKTEQVIGAQRTSLAAQGVDVNRGSALDVQADAAYLGELDAQTIKNNAAKEAWGYRVQASDYRARGKTAKREGEFGAFNTILTSAGEVLLARYGGGSGKKHAPDMDFDPYKAGR